MSSEPVRLESEMQNARGINRADRWFTVNEYVSKYLPGLYYFYMNIDEALGEEVERAAEIATKLNISARYEVNFTKGIALMAPRYPEIVWYTLFT